MPARRSLPASNEAPHDRVTTTASALRPRRPAAALTAAADITGRNLRRLVRVPTLLVFATLQPVLFVLLFSHAFGGAGHVPGTAR